MLALLPLDDRPSNHDFPAQIAAIGGSTLLMPPRLALGRFSVPGDAAALLKWLETLPLELDALIVSVDMLAYGGLVASRRPETDVAVALERLQALRAWRAARPGVPIYAFNVLMRLAVTMDSDEAIACYYNVMRWARLSDEAVRFKSEYLSEQLHQVEAQIPPHVLRDYRAARARNHQVNLAMVDWLAEGVLDFLLMPQEDCTEYGLHRIEQAAVLERVSQRSVTEKFVLHPGADEAALTLLAHSWQPGLRLRLRVSNATDMEHIATFEDIPYGKSLDSHLATVGGCWVSEQPDLEFFVNAPVGNAQKDESEESLRARKLNLATFADEVCAAVDGGARVAICDVAFPNGADDVLMRQLEKRNLLGRLSAFAGWNTAGNTTGTVLSQCAAIRRSDEQCAHGSESAPCAARAQLNQRFVFERLLDDWCYQSHVRGRIDRSAREKGLSPLKMESGVSGMETLTRLELNGFAHMLAARQFHMNLEKLEVLLPWGRTFEVELSARLSDPVESKEAAPA